MICDLIEQNIVILSKTEKVNMIKPTKVLMNIITNNMVFNIPNKLPMLVHPKLYTKEQSGVGGLLIKGWTNYYFIN